MQALPMVFCLLFTTVASVLFDSQGKSWHVFFQQKDCHTIYLLHSTFTKNTHKKILIPMLTNEQCVDSKSDPYKYLDILIELGYTEQPNIRYQACWHLTWLAALLSSFIACRWVGLQTL